jgi:hypothetical protein
VILVYITIPSMASFPQEHILPNGSLDMAKYDMTTLLPKYTIREVVLVSKPSSGKDVALICP